MILDFHDFNPSWLLRVQGWILCIIKIIDIFAPPPSFSKITFFHPSTVKISFSISYPLFLCFFFLNHIFPKLANFAPWNWNWKIYIPVRVLSCIKMPIGWISRGIINIVFLFTFIHLSRLPLHLFYDLGPNGSLCHILSAMYKFKSEQGIDLRTLRPYITLFIDDM